jgi:formylglycine-generating enzyme required for sulfatase activity
MRQTFIGVHPLRRWLLLPSAGLAALGCPPSEPGRLRAPSGTSELDAGRASPPSIVAQTVARDVGPEQGAVGTVADAGAAPAIPTTTDASPQAVPLPASDADCPAVSTCPAGMSRVPGGASRHGWYLCSFCLDLTEVTVAAYERCVHAGVCAEPDAYDAKDAWRWLCNWKHPEGRANHPVNGVSLNDARTYCAWVHRRLPTGTERAWAAGGGDEHRPFPWGSLPPAPALLNGCGLECLDEMVAHGQLLWPDYIGRDAFPRTAPVGSFAKGAARWGQLDMSGNVAEYIDDEFPSACGGNFFTRTVQGKALDAFRSDACQATTPADRSPLDGIRCASEGHPIRRDAFLRPLAP